MTGAFSVIICLIYAVIGYNIYRSFPAQIAYGLLAYKRNALVRNDTFIIFADKSTVDTLNG